MCIYFAYHFKIKENRIIFNFEAKNGKNVYRLGEKGDLDEKLGKKRMGNDERKES